MVRVKMLAPALIAGIGTLAAVRALRRRERFDFRERSVVVTGGSRGLGLVLAREFAAEGAWLTILARDAAELERARVDLEARGAQVLSLVCDVRDRKAVEDAIARVMEHYGRIDVLINNAGIIQAGPIEHMTLADFEDTLAVHLWASLYTIYAVLPAMRRQGGGRIVNIASIGGRISIPHLVPYCTSKFALVGLSQGMRAELEKDGITITTVCPGLMRTGSPFNALFKGQHQREFTWFLISDSLPLITMDARRAARQIIEACRVGRPHLTISTAARALEIANGLMPGLVTRISALATRILPGPTTEAGMHSKTGWESRTTLAPSALTRMSNQAATRNNEVGSSSMAL